MEAADALRTKISDLKKEIKAAQKEKEDYLKANPL